MPDTTLVSLIAGGAVLALAGFVVWWRRRARRRALEVGELPTFLYLAGQTPPDGGAARPARPVPGRTVEHAWSQARPGSRRPESSIGWAPPADETVQLLPGRLEPVSGDGGQEIRFVRRPGVRRFTLGRSRGAAHEHVQLRAPSASRMHAFMEFEDGRWRIGSLSQTNSVIINGSPLHAEIHRLDDGDRIELGEAVFIFRHPSPRGETPAGASGGAA